MVSLGKRPYYLDGSIPGARCECVFRGLVPKHRECFSLVLMVVHDRIGVDSEVKQLDGAIAAGGKHLVLVDLRPGHIV